MNRAASKILTSTLKFTTEQCNANRQRLRAEARHAIEMLSAVEGTQNGAVLTEIISVLQVLLQLESEHYQLCEARHGLNAIQG